MTLGTNAHSIRSAIIAGTSCTKFATEEPKGWSAKWCSQTSSTGVRLSWFDEQSEAYRETSAFENSRLAKYKQMLQKRVIQNGNPAYDRKGEFSVVVNRLGPHKTE